MITQEELELMAAQIIKHREYDEYPETCRFCDEPWGNQRPPDEHAPDCVVLIAKRVLLGEEPK